MNKLEKLPILNFRHFCYTLGVVPTSYLDTLTDAELKIWLCKFLTDEVIPAVNNNANALKELQDYLQNLDVQDEIDIKLDEMAKDGTLSKILNNDLLTDIRNNTNKNAQDIENLNNDINEKITTLQNNIFVQLEKLKTATPTAVDSLDNMLDTDKIYVLTTDGNWYYYNTETSTWTAGGTYQATNLANNSIYTPQIKTVDHGKINENGYYLLPLPATQGIANTSDNDNIITFSAETGQFIGSNRAGFDLMFYVDPEVKNYEGLYCVNEITGNNTDFYIQFPDIDYVSMATYKNGNCYTCMSNNQDLQNYLQENQGKYIKMRYEFTNNSGINVVVKPKYFNRMTKETKNLLNLYEGSKPYILNPKNDAGVYNYDKLNKQITFNFDKNTGLRYNVNNIDITKDLVIEVKKIKGNDIDPFFIWTDSTGVTHYDTETSQRITSTNSKRVIPKEYLAKNNITSAYFVLATTQDATATNNFQATIKFPYILQYNYSGDLTETFNSIYNSIKSANNSKLFEKSLCVAGDSMAYGHTLSRNQVWDTLIANRNSMTLQNTAKNGKFLSRYYFNNNVATQYTEEQITNVDNPGLVDSIKNMTGNPDFIAIHCGTNDLNSSVPLGTETDTSYNTFYGCVYNVCLQLINKFPTANILFITPYAHPSKYEHDCNYIDAIINTCKKFGIKTFDSRTAGLNIENTAQKTALMLDNTHLNATGQLRVSYKYEAELNML